jgi:hypothetical protein
VPGSCAGEAALPRVGVVVNELSVDELVDEFPVDVVVNELSLSTVIDEQSVDAAVPSTGGSVIKVPPWASLAKLKLEGV